MKRYIVKSLASTASIYSMEGLSHKSKETITVATDKNGNKTECINYQADHCFEYQGKLYAVLFSQG
jgi:hypothetical protein